MDATNTTRSLPQRQRPHAWLALAGCLALCFAAAGIGGAATGPEIAGWYAGLQKPSFNPPNWVFGPVWSVLYTVMAVVLWQIWRTPVIGRHDAVLRRRALVAFLIQLSLNVLWSVVFFGSHGIVGGMVVVVMLWVGVAWTIAAALPVIGGKAWWLAPYLAWVTFAGVLNAAILLLNR